MVRPPGRSLLLVVGRSRPCSSPARSAAHPRGTAARGDVSIPRCWSNRAPGWRPPANQRFPPSVAQVISGLPHKPIVKRDDVRNDRGHSPLLPCWLPRLVNPARGPGCRPPNSRSSRIRHSSHDHVVVRVGECRAARRTRCSTIVPYLPDQPGNTIPVHLTRLSVGKTTPGSSSPWRNRSPVGGLMVNQSIGGPAAAVHHTDDAGGVWFCNVTLQTGR